MTSVLILNGPNLGRLGRREPEVYGRRTHDQLAAQLIECGSQLGLQVEVRQTDAEAEMISWLHEAADRGLPVVLNAAAWTHYSVAVADAVAQLGSGLIEVHLSNVYAREEFRRVSLISAYADGVIVGLGALGYDLALCALAQRNEASA